MESRLVSILVRSRNDGAFVAATLKAILAQDCEIPFEVLCCDDASTDETPALVASFPQVRRLPRPEGEYRPGRRLNYMVSQARGDIVVFNNADAIPQSTHWLAELIAPLLADTADAVYGNQVPRKDAKWLVRKDYARAFGDGKTAAQWDFFFSLATSAIRRKSLQEEPFDEEIRYSEDVEWAHRRKRRIAYAPKAVVEHSHNYTLSELKRRFYGEGYADAQIFGRTPTLAREMLSGAMETLRDFAYLVRHPAGLAELPMAPIRRWIQRYYHWKGGRAYERDKAAG